MNLLHYIKLQSDENEIEQLKARLRQFGLCPDDWNIKQVRLNHYIIENKSDHNFYFTGHTRNSGGRKTWLRIALKNI